VDALGGEDVVADHINERHQGCRGGVNPICQRRDIEIDAFAFIDVALAIDEVRRPNADGGRARGAEVVKRTGPPAASPIPARRDYYHRGFNFPAHRNLRVSEGVENLLR
jgi:hypothetical protein